MGNEYTTGAVLVGLTVSLLGASGVVFSVVVGVRVSALLEAHPVCMLRSMQIMNDDITRFMFGFPLARYHSPMISLGGPPGPA